METSFEWTAILCFKWRQKVWRFSEESWTKPILIFIDHWLNYILLILCRTFWPSSLKPLFDFHVAIDLYIFHKPTNIIAAVSFICFDAFSLALRFTTWFTSSIYLTPPTFSTAQDGECLVSVIFRKSLTTFIVDLSVHLGFFEFFFVQSDMYK